MCIHGVNINNPICIFDTKQFIHTLTYKSIKEDKLQLFNTDYKDKDIDIEINEDDINKDDY